MGTKSGDLTYTSVDIYGIRLVVSNMWDMVHQGRYHGYKIGRLDVYINGIFTMIYMYVYEINNASDLNRSPSSTTQRTHSSSASKPSSQHHHHHSKSHHGHHHHHRRHRSKPEDHTDELVNSNTEIKRPISLTNMSLPTPLHSNPVKKGFRNWNPPMLGALPDDFLRLTVPKANATPHNSLEWANWPSPFDAGGSAKSEHSPRNHNISRKDRHSERHVKTHSDRKKLSRSVSERSGDKTGGQRGLDRLPLVHSHSTKQDTSPGLPKSLVSTVQYKHR